MPPKFIFVRHGEAQHNVAFREKGPPAFEDPANRDAPLTPTGIEQARATGKTLTPLKIAAIWSSPLKRCIQTAEEIYEEVDVNDLYLHDSLLECLGGNHVCNERMPKHALRKEFPIWKRDFLPELPAAWIGRETGEALYQRMLSFVMWLAHIYRDLDSDTHIVIVGHATAFGTLLGKKLNNAEHVITTLEEILAPAGTGSTQGPKSVEAIPFQDEVFP